MRSIAGCRFNEYTLLNCQVCAPSFLEYIAAGSALNLAFAIDFSRPETAVDEQAVRHYVDDVELVVGSFGEPLREFNRFGGETGNEFVFHHF